MINVSKFLSKKVIGGLLLHLERKKDLFMGEGGSNIWFILGLEVGF